MTTKNAVKISVVIPNWNGKDSLGDCLDSLLAQTLPARIIVVENGSTDGSLEFVREKYPSVELVVHEKNLGFDGGVNSGIRRAMELGDEFVALFNNDAVAEKNWLKNLLAALENNHKAGIATSKIMSIDGEHLDSTGDLYTIWGLPFPRGRGEKVSDEYDNDTLVFGASGGASLYRIEMFEKIGLFDEDFFAYYEDTDISFRAQLSGWKVVYAPKAVVYHQIGATSGKIKDFTTYQTIKNLPWVVWKNVPGTLLPTVLPRFTLAYLSFVARAVQRGQIKAAVKGLSWSLIKLPKKLIERRRIQKNKQVSTQYISSIMLHDLPPNAHKLRNLRAKWWKLTRKS
jgi:GT2 family glycosyltransferase